VKPWVTTRDIVTALRFPLAIPVPVVRSPPGSSRSVTARPHRRRRRFLARRVGASRAGALLDPCRQGLHGRGVGDHRAPRVALWYERDRVLLRDILAVPGFFATWLLHRPSRLPARAGGKAVTVAQLLTLVAAIADWTYTRHLAWATRPLQCTQSGITAHRRAGRGGHGGPAFNAATHAMKESERECRIVVSHW